MVNQGKNNEQVENASELAPKKPRRPIRWVMFGLWGLVIVLALGLLIYYQNQTQSEPCLQAVAMPGGETLGGAFTALDENGQEVSEKDVITEPSLVYFGYTFCPDVCPIDTARNAEVTDILAGKGVDITPIFITVDPERDTRHIQLKLKN